MIINEPVFFFGILLALVFFGIISLGRFLTWLQDWIAGKIHRKNTTDIIEHAQKITTRNRMYLRSRKKR